MRIRKIHIRDEDLPYAFYRFDGIKILVGPGKKSVTVTARRQRGDNKIESCTVSGGDYSAAVNAADFGRVRCVFAGSATDSALRVIRKKQEFEDPDLPKFLEMLHGPLTFVAGLGASDRPRLS